MYIMFMFFHLLLMKQFSLAIRFNGCLLAESRKSLELDKVAKNLSGDKNPGSRLLLDEMKSRKNTGENFKELIINFSTIKTLF